MLLGKKENSYQKLKRIHKEEKESLIKDIMILIEGDYIRSFHVRKKWLLRIEIENAIMKGDAT